MSQQFLDDYLLTVEDTVCNSCGFFWCITQSDPADLVCFENLSHNEVKWLPVYGVGGYLDLLECLIPSFSRTETITAQVAKLASIKLKELQMEDSENVFVVRQNENCPECGSSDTKLISAKHIHSKNLPRFNWEKFFH